MNYQLDQPRTIEQTNKKQVALSPFFTEKIKTKGNNQRANNQLVNNKLNPLIRKIDHFMNLQPMIQQKVDRIKFNTIITALVKSIPPVKNVTAEIPKNTWETAINTFDQYWFSLADSFRITTLVYTL